MTGAAEGESEEKKKPRAIEDQKSLQSSTLHLHCYLVLYTWVQHVHYHST